MTDDEAPSAGDGGVDEGRARSHPAVFGSDAAAAAAADTDHDPRARPIGGASGSRNRIAPLLALMLVVNLAASLYQLPLNRAVERRLCREYYDRHHGSLPITASLGWAGDFGLGTQAGTRARRERDDIDERLCKVDEVQQGLAWIQGVMETAWIVGGKMAFPLDPLTCFSSFLVS